ncbi:MAG: hypothetical protein IPF52_10530 [Saprospiraceae bacterium]|nr:hypothetical protein [Saprospiraceae bacterium]
MANGDENMDYVSTLIHLAEWMVFQNNFAEAEKYMLTAKKYMENNRIDINDNYLLLLALFEKKALYDQDKSAALKYLEKELFTIQQQLDHLSLIGAEHEMLKFIEKSEIYLNRYLGFCLNNIRDVDFEVTLLENVLFFKHYLLTDYQSRRNFAQADIEHREDYLKYFQVNQEILRFNWNLLKMCPKLIVWYRKSKNRTGYSAQNEKRISGENKVSWEDLQRQSKKVRLL